jgi:hypothetical protein
MTYSNNPRSIKAGSGIVITTDTARGTGSESITISAPGGQGYPGYYGDFYSDQTQTNPVINTANLLTLNQNRGNDGINLLPSSRIQFPHAGVYNLTINAQVNITQGGPGNISMWLVQNNLQVIASNGIVTVEGGGRSNVISRRYFPRVSAGDYIEVYWSSDSINFRLAATGPQSNPTRPSTPSASVTVQFIQE